MKIKKIFIVSMLLYTITDIFAQDTIFNQNNIYIVELKNSIECSRINAAYSLYYSGNLSSAIASLEGVSFARVKSSNKVLTPNIIIDINRIPTPYNQERMAYKFLSKYYNFSVNQRYDTCDVWVLRKSTVSKLVKFDENNDSVVRYSRFTPDKKGWEGVGITINDLAYNIEEIFDVIVSEDNSDEEYYNFLIPATAFKSVLDLKEYLFKNYGLILEKDRKLEWIYFIDFNN